MAHWKQRETVFDAYELALKLPGPWQLRPSTSAYRWLYRSADQHKEHLTISREEPGAPTGGEKAMLQHWVQRHRRAMELEFGRVGELTLGAPEFGERFGQPCVHYLGEAPSAGHHFEVLFLCPPRTIWTLVYDAFRLTPEQASEHARSIFENAVLRW